MQHSKPRPPVNISLANLSDAKYDFSAPSDKIRVVNFWALWCSACRKELPSLSALEKLLDEADFEILTVAVGKNDPRDLTHFTELLGVDNLPVYLDPNMDYARSARVAAIPHTIVLDRDGHEISAAIGKIDFIEPEIVELFKSFVQN